MFPVAGNFLRRLVSHFNFWWCACFRWLGLFQAYPILILVCDDVRVPGGWCFSKPTCFTIHSIWKCSWCLSKLAGWCFSYRVLSPFRCTSVGCFCRCWCSVSDFLLVTLVEEYRVPTTSLHFGFLRFGHVNIVAAACARTASPYYYLVFCFHYLQFKQS